MLTFKTVHGIVKVSVIIPMKATEQFNLVVLFIMLYEMVLIFESALHG